MRRNRPKIPHNVMLAFLSKQVQYNAPRIWTSEPMRTQSRMLSIAYDIYVKQLKLSFSDSASAVTFCTSPARELANDWSARHKKPRRGGVLSRAHRPSRLRCC